MKKFAAMVILAIGATACQPSPGNGCVEIAPPYDKAPHIPMQKSFPGYYDFDLVGKKGYAVWYGHAKWNGAKHVLGYTIAEDAGIWNTANCARTQPGY